MKERAAEQKRLEVEQKRMTKEEFDRTHKTKTVASAAPKAQQIKKIDSAGIAKGVVDGSSANKVGGAGGKALLSGFGVGLSWSSCIMDVRGAIMPPLVEY